SSHMEPEAKPDLEEYGTDVVSEWRSAGYGVSKWRTKDGLLESASSGHASDLDPSTARKSGHLNSRACGEISFLEETSIDGVHTVKVFKIHQMDIGADHILHAEANRG